MTNNKGSINLVGTPFAQRLRELREQRHLSKNDLAEKADLSYRTIHDLEAGRRDRILEKTAMLLATALEVPLDALLDKYANGNGANGNSANGNSANGDGIPEGAGGARPPSWARLVSVIGVTLALIAVAGFITWQQSVSRAVWEVDGGTIVMKDAYLGIELWRLDTGAKTTMCNLAPWSDDEFLVADRRTPVTGGSLLCLERSSGEVIWEFRPDMERVIAAFGEEDVLAATMNCLRYKPADMDGDGEPEVIAEFVHGLYYPSVLARVDRHGRLLNQYANKGHLYDTAALDLDHDGKDEYLALGTNNSKAYQGATLLLLDDEHFRGAAVDSLTDAWSTEPDSAVVRLVFPHYPEPVRSQVQAVRLGGYHLRIHCDAEENHEVLITVAASPSLGHDLVVTLDEQLRPLKIDIADAFLAHINATWPDSLKNGTGPGDPAWREAWLGQHLRFEAGHRSQ